MCEWLSCGEWCDVRLTCAGRTFSAHRPVLASVSAFLRRVLLSCPLDETPTFIVLPEFDLDAMSAVLFYIYNGEVSVEKRKLTLFLEIIRTLEIFVDEQCLQKLRECVGVRNLDLCTYRESRCSKNVFTLSSGNSNEHEYVNIRKGERVQDVRVQNSMSKSHLIEKNRCRRNVQTTLENLPTFFGDRQRNCFLRDLYIETYPQNGNVNGLTGGVLAISSERYRAPTSVLLTNANGKLPGSVDAVLSDTRKSTENMSFIPNISNKQFHCIQNCSEPRNEMYVKRFYDNGNVKNLTVENTKNLIESYNLKSAWMNRLSSQICSQSLSPELQSRYLLTAGPSLDLSTVPKSLDSLVPSFSLSGLNIRQSNVERGYMKCHLNAQCSDSPSYYKAPIFNHVLESPWCPRLPYTYKPFKRKAITVSVASRDKKGDIAISNDNNNNIDQKPLSVQSKEEEENVGTKEKFKCSICNQVFFDEEGLTCHSKRHTTAARYSCGECGKTFSQLRNFKYHMSVHRGTREFAATCTVCGKYFNDRGYLSSHMKIHRNRKEYKCSLCPKSFNQRVAYNMHVRIHTGVKPHVCDECGKAFSRKMLLKQHQRTHSGERPYACPHCDKRFADRSNMTLHLRLHTGVKPFSCSLCSKSFTKKHHLKSHLNFHTGAKPYSCPRCKLAFTQSSNMRTHLKKCTAPENIGSV